MRDGDSKVVVFFVSMLVSAAVNRHWRPKSGCSELLSEKNYVKEKKKIKH